MLKLLTKASCQSCTNIMGSPKAELRFDDLDGSELTVKLYQVDVDSEIMTNDPDKSSRFNVWSAEAEWRGRQKFAEGYEIGLQIGAAERESMVCRLIGAMERTEENLQLLLEALSDPDKLKTLFKKYGIAPSWESES
ncbi:MAG: hypothetical protein IJ228_07490 [Succinivibrio sp.]|nr:hypothetical protein [Succinivibrio sp.]